MVALQKPKQKPRLKNNKRTNMTDTSEKQLLHLVIGGELSNLEDIEFKDLDKVDIVGVFPNYASAYDIWKTKAQMTVDEAQTRYFIVHLHRLMTPHD
jgi:hypothetical protein